MKPVLIFILIIFFSISCVQIPQESINLSHAMGEDIRQIYMSHTNLVNLYFDAIDQNINSFVDNVYAPYQIGKLVEADLDDLKNGLDDTLSGALRNASNDPEVAKKAQENISVFVRYVHEEIEAYRSELSAPIKEQRMEILSALEKSYMNLISANESITAHLSSIKKVKDTQSDLLNQIGIQQDLNEQMGDKIANLSGQIHTIIGKANNIDQKSDDAVEQFNAIKEKIINLTNH